MTSKVHGCYIPQHRAQHFAKRASPLEVHEVLENKDSPPLWVKTKSLGRSPAYLVYGRSAEGRYLLIPVIILQEPPLNNMFMPVTVRDMTTRERNYYNKTNRKGG
ncbi:MAG: hypothetical protein AB1402_07880 [Bacillota bacterium]